MKGKAEPLVLLAGEGGASLGSARTSSVAYTTPFVGRELERPLLHRDVRAGAPAAFGAAGHDRRRAGGGQEPPRRGAVRLPRRAAGARPAGGRGVACPYGEGITFWALGEIVKAEAGILESDAPTAATAKLDAAVPRRSGSGRGCCSVSAPLLGIEAGLRRRSGRSCSRPGGASSRGSPRPRPAVLVFEDLHWARRGSARVLGASGRVGGGRAAARSLHCAAGAVRAASGLGCGDPERDDDQPAAALGSRRRPSSFPRSLIATSVLSAELEQRVLERAAVTPCMRRSSFVCLPTATWVPARWSCRRACRR